MIKILRNKKILIFCLLVFIVAYLAFWRAFSFDFWGEDWEQLWFAVFNPSMINNQYEAWPHPIVIYEELFLAKILGPNPFYWQIVGYLLKVLGALAVSLMMLGLTRSKRAAFFTGLIYASSVGGLASFTWIAAHASALMIPFLCLGIYFWVIKKKYVVALALLIFSIWSDPARGILGSFLVILWDILSLVQKSTKDSSTKPWKRIVILVIAIFFLKSFLGQRVDQGLLSTLDANINFIVNHPTQVLTNFLNTSGNLLVGWFIPIPQNVFAVSMPTIIGIAAGYLFLFQTAFLLVYFFQKKYESIKILLLFSIWIAIFFLPNWLLASTSMIGGGQVLGVTHRYLTLSAVGLACYLGYVLARVKHNYLQSFLLLFIVGSNILISNQILKKDSYYRSVEMTKPIWDRIEKDVPVGEENSLFFIQGEDKFKVNDISQAKIPFAMRRGIKSFDKWPIATSDREIVKRLLCGNADDGRKVPLSHLHAWYINRTTVDNISEKARKEFSEIECNQL